MVLLDTNILLRRTDPGAPEYAAVAASLQSLLEHGDPCCICSQSLVELWAVLTRMICCNDVSYPRTL